MNGLKRTPAQIEQRQRLCDELYWSIKNELDMSARRGGLLDEILDRFVYELDNKEVEEYEDLVVNQFGID
tara:strand:+ start:146 stop:355 length:210 start_codon:yes stop_codon:yes gene_type:complete